MNGHTHRLRALDVTVRLPYACIRMSQGQTHFDRGVNVTWDPYMSKARRAGTHHRPRQLGAVGGGLLMSSILILMCRVEQEVTTHTHEF